MTPKDCKELAYIVCAASSDEECAAEEFNDAVIGLELKPRVLERTLVRVCDDLNKRGIRLFGDYESLVFRFVYDLEQKQRYLEQREGKHAGQTNDGSCPYCTGGKVVLFTSVVECEICGGTGKSPNE